MVPRGGGNSGSNVVDSGVGMRWQTVVTECGDRLW
jgi:hypothetical protein